MRTCRHCEQKFDQDEPIPGCKTLGEGKPCEGKPRGFAALSRERVAEIAAKGGVSAHQNGRAHQFSSEEAKAAGGQPQ